VYKGEYFPDLFVSLELACRQVTALSYLACNQDIGNSFSTTNTKFDNHKRTVHFITMLTAK